MTYAPNVVAQRVGKHAPEHGVAGASVRMS
jgi:hypothetical protein